MEEGKNGIGIRIRIRIRIGDLEMELGHRKRGLGSLK